MLKRKKKNLLPEPDYTVPSGEEQYTKTLEENRKALSKTKSESEVSPEEEETLKETMRKQVEESKYRRGGMVKSNKRGCGVAVRGFTKGRIY
jgi:hypothetical protein